MHGARCEGIAHSKVKHCEKQDGASCGTRRDITRSKAGHCAEQREALDCAEQGKCHCAGQGRCHRAEQGKASREARQASSRGARRGIAWGKAGHQAEQGVRVSHRARGGMQRREGHGAEVRAMHQTFTVLHGNNTTHRGTRDAPSHHGEAGERCTQNHHIKGRRRTILQKQERSGETSYRDAATSHGGANSPW